MGLTEGRGDVILLVRTRFPHFQQPGVSLSMSASTKHDPIPGLVLNSPHLREAVSKAENLPILINAVSQRVRQLNSGHKALVRLEGEPSKTEIALAEIAMGLIEIIPEETEILGDFSRSVCCFRLFLIS